MDNGGAAGVPVPSYAVCPDSRRHVGITAERASLYIRYARIEHCYDADGRRPLLAEIAVIA